MASLPFLEKANPKAAVQGQVDQVLQAQAPVALVAHVAHVVHVALAVPVVLVASEKALWRALGLELSQFIQHVVISISCRITSLLPRMPGKGPPGKWESYVILGNWSKLKYALHCVLSQWFVMLLLRQKLAICQYWKAVGFCWVCMWWATALELQDPAGLQLRFLKVPCVPGE